MPFGQAPHTRGIHQVIPSVDLPVLSQHSSVQNTFGSDCNV